MKGPVLQDWPHSDACINSRASPHHTADQLALNVGVHPPLGFNNWPEQFMKTPHLVLWVSDEGYNSGTAGWQGMGKGRGAPMPPRSLPSSQHQNASIRWEDLQTPRSLGFHYMGTMIDHWPLVNQLPAPRGSPELGGDSSQPRVLLPSFWRPDPILKLFRGPAIRHSLACKTLIPPRIPRGSELCVRTGDKD